MKLKLHKNNIMVREMNWRKLRSIQYVNTGFTLRSGSFRISCQNNEMEIQESNGEQEHAIPVCSGMDSSHPVTRRRVFIISRTLGIQSTWIWL